MPGDELFEATTKVRSTRVRLMWLVAGSMIAVFVLANVFHHHLLPRPALPALAIIPGLILPILLMIQRRPKIASMRVKATPAGISLGTRFVPREKLRSALLRHEAAGTFVALKGADADVEVKDDDEGERLCRALALDAKSTTAEFLTFRQTEPVSTTVRLGALGVALSTNARRRVAKLVVGDDGIVVKQGWGAPTFLPHEDIVSVTAARYSIVVTTRDDAFAFRVSSELSNDSSAFGLARHAQSVAWRIDQALKAHRSLAGDAPQVLALHRGGESARDWIARLRRIGQGANATFRNVVLSREQLLGIVESTSAAAIDRLAAIVALRDGLTNEERPRIRVATERCAEPTMREWMVRVASVPDEELIAAFEEDSASATSDDEEAGEEHAERHVASRRR